MTIKVKRYSYRIGGKTVKVKAHTRKGKAARRAGRRAGRRPSLKKAFAESAANMRRRAPRKRRFNRVAKSRRR